MKNYVMNSTTLPYLSNEIDYLAFIGVNTANIVRYVKTTKQINEEMLATRLGISLIEERELENMQSPISDQWRRKLRLMFL